MSGVSPRHVVMAGAGLVGLATAATSAVSLYGLAVMCGIPELLAAALPIALDAGAAVAALIWVTEQGALRKWGRAVALVALVATLAGNGVAHIYTIEGGRPPIEVVLAVGACIPAMLFAVIHLAALVAREPTRSAALHQPPAAAEAAAAAAPEVSAAETSSTPASPPRPGKPAVRRSRKPGKPTVSPREWAQQHWPVTGAEVQMATGASKGYAYRVVAEIRAAREAVS